METKLIAAELATGAGVATVICHSNKPSNIQRIIALPPPSSTDPIHLLRPDEEPPDPLHTLFVPHHAPIPDRRWWILHGLAPKGRLIIDDGAYRAIFRNKRDSLEGNGGRLLAAGLVEVEGTFAAHQAVRIAVRRSKAAIADGTSSMESSVDDLKQLALTGQTEIVDVGRGLANYNWQEMERIKGHNRCVCLPTSVRI
jgi:glutamate 5-kinase